MPVLPHYVIKMVRQDPFFDTAPRVPQAHDAVPLFPQAAPVRGADAFVVFTLDPLKRVTGRQVVPDRRETDEALLETVFRFAVQHNAHRILAGRVTSRGAPRLTRGDGQLIQRLTRAAATVAISLVDYVVVGTRFYVLSSGLSFRVPPRSPYFAQGGNAMDIPLYQLKVEQVGTQSVEQTTITHVRDAERIFWSWIHDADREHFVLMTLDVQNHVTGLHTVAMGDLITVEVHPREVFKIALLLNATRIIVAHNHPGGEADPSEQDESLTRQLVQAGQLLGIPVWDHLIIGAQQTFSARQAWPALFPANPSSFIAHRTH